jgi:methylglutaconyl-CoA hydratase
MSYQTLKLDHAVDIATLTLNRPDKRNALTGQMISELIAAFKEIEASAARIMLITGAGGAFCSGMDIDELRSAAAQSFDQALADARLVATMLRELYIFPKPVIAAVNGAAIAGGCGIATLADFTLATPETKLGYPEVHIGFMPAIVSAFLVRQVGDKLARDLLLTGRIISAEEALRIGLVTEIVPALKLADKARELALELLNASPMSLVFTKRLLRGYAQAELGAHLELAIQESARIRVTKDFREGLAAFLEKRKPKWRGI